MNLLKAARYRLEWVGILLIAKIVPRLSRRTCVRLANALGAVIFCFDRRSRRVAIANLELVFGDRFTKEQQRKIARASHQNFARSVLDLFWVPRLNRENFRRYIDLENFDVLTSAKGGSIALNIHFGSFEWGHAAAGFYGHTGFGVAASFKNQLLTRTFSRLREASGHRMIEQERSMLRFFKALKRSGHVGMLGDLTLPPSQASTVIDCFGLKTCVPLIHAILHQRTGAPIVPMLSFPLPDGRCRAVAYPPLSFSPKASAQQIAQTCWDFFEPKIRENPELWMWAYKHWRYRPANATRPYPFYANVSSSFERLFGAAKNLTKALP
jgi:KDO2-lipid IV(A) lauroyltransferase